MDGGDLCDLLNHQVLPPVLRPIKQLIKLFGRHFFIKTAKGAFDGALDDDLLLVRHEENTAASILPNRLEHLVPDEELNAITTNALNFHSNLRGFKPTLKIDG